MYLTLTDSQADSVQEKMDIKYVGKNKTFRPPWILLKNQLKN